MKATGANGHTADGSSASLAQHTVVEPCPKAQQYPRHPSHPVSVSLGKAIHLSYITCKPACVKLQLISNTVHCARSCQTLICSLCKKSAGVANAWHCQGCKGSLAHASLGPCVWTLCAHIAGPTEDTRLAIFTSPPLPPCLVYVRAAFLAKAAAGLLCPLTHTQHWLGALQTLEN
jgi:hypothetical protein